MFIRTDGIPVESMVGIGEVYFEWDVEGKREREIVNYLKRVLRHVGPMRFVDGNGTERVPILMDQGGWSPTESFMGGYFQITLYDLMCAVRFTPGAPFSIAAAVRTLPGGETETVPTLIRAEYGHSIHFVLASRTMTTLTSDMIDKMQSRDEKTGCQNSRGDSSGTLPIDPSLLLMTRAKPVVYHATRAAAIQSIMRIGICPGGDSNEALRNYNYAWPQFPINAHKNMYKSRGDCGIAIEIDLAEASEYNNSYLARNGVVALGHVPYQCILRISITNRDTEEEYNTRVIFDANLSYTPLKNGIMPVYVKKRNCAELADNVPDDKKWKDSSQEFVTYAIVNMTTTKGTLVRTANMTLENTAHTEEITRLLYDAARIDNKEWSGMVILCTRCQVIKRAGTVECEICQQQFQYMKLNETDAGGLNWGFDEEADHRTISYGVLRNPMDKAAGEPKQKRQKSRPPEEKGPFNTEKLNRLHLKKWDSSIEQRRLMSSMGTTRDCRTPAYVVPWVANRWDAVPPNHTKEYTLRVWKEYRDGWKALREGIGERRFDQFENNLKAQAFYNYCYMVMERPGGNRLLKRITTFGILKAVYESQDQIFAGQDVTWAVGVGRIETRDYDVGPNGEY